MSELWHACKAGNLPLVQELVAQGRDVNYVNGHEGGETPLMISLYEEHHSVSEYMASLAKVDVSTTDAQGATALLYACWCGGGGQIIRDIAGRMTGRGVNQRDVNGMSALMAAVYHGNTEGVEVLGMMDRVEWDHKKMVRMAR